MELLLMNAGECTRGTSKHMLQKECMLVYLWTTKTQLKKKLNRLG